MYGKYTQVAWYGCGGICMDRPEWIYKQFKGSDHTECDICQQWDIYTDGDKSKRMYGHDKHKCDNQYATGSICQSDIDADL